MMRTGGRITALLLAGGVLITACGGRAAQPDVPIGSADPFPGNTSSTAAPAPDPAVQARMQATAALKSYNTVDNTLNKNPAGDRAAIATVTTGQATRAMTTSLDSIAAAGVRLQGESVIANVNITDVNITGATAEVRATVCFDLTHARGVDKAGKDITSPQRPNMRKGVYTVTNARWPDPKSWLVSNIDQKNEPCTAA